VSLRVGLSVISFYCFVVLDFIKDALSNSKKDATSIPHAVIANKQMNIKQKAPSN
jgi:hypothetical protein